MSLRITIDDEQMRRRLDEIAGGLRDATPLLRVWGEIMRTSIEQNFATGGRPPWEPLAPSTIRRRSRRTKSLRRAVQRDIARGTLASIGGFKPLFRTGTLARSIIYEPDRNSLTIGSNLPYAAIHQFGGQAGRNRAVTIPARPYILLQSEDEEDMRAAAIAYLRNLGEAQ